MPSIKMLTLNIERTKHLEQVLLFLEREQPDVFCVQELCAADIEKFSAVLGKYFVTVPMSRHTTDGGECLFSIGIFSRYPLREQAIEYYYKTTDALPVFVGGEMSMSTVDRAFLSCEVMKEGESFRVGTTHFTWTPDGEADDVQRRDIVNLLQILEKQGEIVFTGDFNAPRGKEIFDRLSERYRDNVPREYTTSIDASLHKAGALPLMVDGIFSTPAYQVQDVRMVCGVSDHCALVAEVQKEGVLK